MIPAPFNYIKAESVDHAVALLTEHGDDAKLLAGGHSLLPLMKLRLAAPSVLIDIGQIRDLSYLRRDGDTVAIGALTRHRDLIESPMLRADAPLLSTVASHVGDPQIRNRGTIGGSLAHADPAADLPCAVLASDATMVVRGPGGRRTVAATDFFISYFQTAIQPNEMLVEIRAPPPARQERTTKSSSAGPTTGPSSPWPPSAATWRWRTWPTNPYAPPPPNKHWPPAHPSPRPRHWPQNTPRRSTTCTPTPNTAHTSHACSPAAHCTPQTADPPQQTPPPPPRGKTASASSTPAPKAWRSAPVAEGACQMRVIPNTRLGGVTVITTSEPRRGNRGCQRWDQLHHRASLVLKSDQQGLHPDFSMCAACLQNFGVNDGRVRFSSGPSGTCAVWPDRCSGAGI
jgi:hypothetical protein